MNFNKDLKDSWTFAVATAILIVLTLLPNLNDDFIGISLLLIAVTLTYSTVKIVKRFKKEGKGNNYLMIYAAGFLSSMWVMEAIEYLH
jgi:prepilin signal peptidase PulO-like enzyme (type II secretory pathway)